MRFLGTSTTANREGDDVMILRYLRRLRDDRILPRTYFTILTVQGNDADGAVCLSTRTHVYTVDSFTTEGELYETAMADLLARDTFIVGDASTVCWYAMTQDASL